MCFSVLSISCLFCFYQIPSNSIMEDLKALEHLWSLPDIQLCFDHYNVHASQIMGLNTFAFVYLHLWELLKTHFLFTLNCHELICLSYCLAFVSGMEARYNCCLSIHQALAQSSNLKNDSALAAISAKVRLLKAVVQWWVQRHVHALLSVTYCFHLHFCFKRTALDAASSPKSTVHTKCVQISETCIHFCLMPYLSKIMPRPWRSRLWTIAFLFHSFGYYRPKLMYALKCTKHIRDCK